MKKIFYVVLALILCFSASACSKKEPEPVKENTITESGTDLMLLEKMNDWLNTTQPGTAGTSLKAVNAFKDMLEWVKDNTPDEETIAKTVQEFFETSEMKEEAKQAFDSMKSVFDSLKDGTAKDLIESAGALIEDFEIDSSVSQTIENIFSAVDKYAK